MEKALNQMRMDIGRKDEYQSKLTGLKNRWAVFEAKSEGLETCYEDLEIYQNDSHNSTEKIIKLTNQLKKKIQNSNMRLDVGEGSDFGNRSSEEAI